MKLCLIVKCYLIAISDKVAGLGDKDHSFYRPLKNKLDFSDSATISLQHWKDTNFGE